MEARAESWIRRFHCRSPDRAALVDDWATPTFSFLRRGELVAKASGCPKAGRGAELGGALAAGRRAPAEKQNGQPQGQPCATRTS